MLVQQSDWRYIAQCEHTTLHLHWDHLTISLLPEAFRALAQQILQEGAKQQEPLPSSLAADPTTVPPATRPKRGLRLRVNTLLVEFPATDLPMLLDLLQQSLTRLDQTEHAATRRLSPQIQIQPYSQRNTFALAQYLN